MTAIIGYQNLLKTGTVTASTEATGFPKENAYDDNTYDAWKPTSVSATLDIDLGSNTSVDYFCLGAHNFATTGAYIYFLHADDAAYTVNLTEAFTGLSPTDDSAIFKAFTSVSKRYWRIQMGAAISSVAFASFGARLDLPVGMRAGFELFSETNNGKTLNSISEGGNLIGKSVINTGKRGQIRLTNLTESWVRSNWPNLRDAIATSPFGFQWDNDRYQNESVLCWLRGPLPVPKYDTPNYMSITIDVDAL